MRLNPYIFGVLALVIFLGTVAAAQIGGYWSVSGKVTGSGEKVAPTGANVDEIKGWMTIGDVATAYQVPLAELLTAFNLPPDTPPTKQLKELESGTFSVTALRAWLKQRLGQ